MRGARALGLALLGTACAAPALARDIEITRACFPGFCLESREAFTVIRRDPAAGKYRVLLSREQAVLYIEAGETPAFPFCRYCTVEELPGERVARRRDTGVIMGRLIGPLTGCAGGAPFYVQIQVYLPGANPGAVSLERAC